MVWLTSLLTTFNPVTPVQEVNSQCLRQLQATKDVYKFTFYHCTISDWNPLPTRLPLLPMSRLSRNLGKASQVCLPSSCDATRLTPPVHSFNQGSGAFYLFYRASQFLFRVTYNLRRLLPLQWKKKKCLF